jgi:hypothetical protein
MVMGCVYFEVRGGLNVYYEDEPRLERVNIMMVVVMMMMMMMDDDDDDDDHAHGVRLRLGTAATTGPIVHPPRDI